MAKTQRTTKTRPTTKKKSKVTPKKDNKTDITVAGTPTPSPVTVGAPTDDDDDEEHMPDDISGLRSDIAQIPKGFHPICAIEKEYWKEEYYKLHGIEDEYCDTFEYEELLRVATTDKQWELIHMAEVQSLKDDGYTDIECAPKITHTKEDYFLQCKYRNDKGILEYYEAKAEFDPYVEPYNPETILYGWLLALYETNEFKTTKNGKTLDYHPSGEGFDDCRGIVFKQGDTIEKSDCDNLQKILDKWDIPYKEADYGELEKTFDDGRKITSKECLVCPKQ